MRIGSILLLVSTAGVVGCRTSGVFVSDEQVSALAPLMPERIDIVEPFTRWVDRGERSGIDGLVMHVQPVNPAGEPVQAAGEMMIELYAFREASADHKGTRLEQWSMPLTTASEQARHWNRATRMYKFRLAFSRETVVDAPGRKFVLATDFRSVLGENRSDECVVELPLARNLLTTGSP